MYNFFKISLVIWVVYLVIVFIRIRRDKNEEHPLALFIRRFVQMFIFTFFSGVILGTLTTGTEKITHTDKYTLVSINDYIRTKENMNGYFFICVGDIESNSVETYNITYAYMDSDDIIRPKTITINKDEEEVGFKEDDLNELEIIHENKILKYNDFGVWLFHDCILKDYASDSRNIDYIFHVPKNSIIKNMTIDFK